MGNMPSPHRTHSTNELNHRASTGQAIKRGEIKISDPIPSSFTHSNVGAEEPLAYEQPSTTPRIESTWFRSEGALSTSSLGRSHGAAHLNHVSRFTERTSLDHALDEGMNMTTDPSCQDVTNSRRSVGIRATIKRMFSKKSKEAPIRNASKRSQSMRFPKQAASFCTAPLQDESQPVVTASSPHMRGESESAVRQGQNAAAKLGHRRNTEPSLLSSQLALSPVLAENSPEELPSLPTTGSEPISERDDPQAKIISPRPSTIIHHSRLPMVLARRRSRSADDLAELAHASNVKRTTQRDRNAELALWRNSFVMDPVPSLPNTEQFKPLEQVAEYEPSSPKASTQDARPSIEPVQEFDFDLGNGTSNDQPTTLRDRVNTLEVKLYDFEFALAKLQGVDVTKPNLPKKASRRKSLRAAFPDSEESSFDQSSNDFSYSSSGSEQVLARSPREHVHDRTSKATTIKPVNRRTMSRSSQMSARSSVRLTRNEYEVLQSLIHGEKLARQQLEILVLNLQKEVDILKSPLFPYERQVKYPTPSPDSELDNMMLRTPRMRRHSPHIRPECNINETSRFSMTETDSDLDDTFPEAFETPEEQNFSFPKLASSHTTMI